MISELTLGNFRNYPKSNLHFNSGSTLIVGPNAVGKTNILEAIYALATGKSFRAETEAEVIREGQAVSRLVGKVIISGTKVAGSPSTSLRASETKEKGRESGSGGTEIELELDWDARERFQKLYKVNGVGRRQIDFIGHLRAVLFSPGDLEIVADSPSTRRRYLDGVLSQVYKDYRLAAHLYERALRQRNRLLWRIREEQIAESVRRIEMEYWDGLLVNNGAIIHERRKEYLEFLNNLPSKIFPIELQYDHSIISPERLEKYAREEIDAAVTLVGPHRDDFAVEKLQDTRNKIQKERDVKLYGSRGEQRLAVFAIKLGELEYVKTQTGENPILLLDDIFSELDHTNRHHILEAIPKQQTIMTTTDLHLVEKNLLKHVQLLELK